LRKLRLLLYFRGYSVIMAKYGCPCAMVLSGGRFGLGCEALPKAEEESTTGFGPWFERNTIDRLGEPLGKRLII
jgi:hypothetical protein